MLLVEDGKTRLQINNEVMGPEWGQTNIGRMMDKRDAVKGNFLVPRDMEDQRNGLWHCALLPLARCETTSNMSIFAI